MAPQRKWRLSDEPLTEDDSDDYLSPEVRSQTRCNIFLGYTSNLISSGLREVILHLVKHKHVAAIVTTAGGIEEDFIKCLGKTYLADFNMDGAELRKKGMNRIGNLIVPNDNYCKFEDWLTPILDAMLTEQKESRQVWTPSSFIRRLGKEINSEESVYYWAYKVNRVSFQVFVGYGQALKIVMSEQYSRILSSVNGWIHRGYDLLPLIPLTWSYTRYSGRYPRSK